MVIPALLLILIASASNTEPARAEPVPNATPMRIPGITPTAASAGLLNATPTGASAGLVNATPATTIATLVTPVPIIAVPVVPAVAPPRAPSPTPVPSVCQLAGPEYRQAGNQTIVLGSFIMDLPDGDYLVATIMRANVSSVQVCFGGDGSVLVLSPANGVEVSRMVRGQAAGAAFDHIVASVRPPWTVGGCLADCGATVVPPGSGLPPGGIRPPNTGDAGLTLTRGS
jgi:hypothetical protein